MNKDFSEAITINNKCIGKINNVLLMKYEIEIPNEQRIKDISKIEDIIEYQESYFKSNNNFNFLGVINVHYCHENKKYYLVDGQHRYHSIKSLTNKGYKKIDIVIELINIDNINQIKDNYKLINKNTELPEFSEHIDKNIPEKVAEHFFEKYPDIWSKGKKSRRPHLNKNYFQEALGVLTEELKLDSIKMLTELVESYNSKISQWTFENFPGHKQFKEPKKIQEKCNLTNFYLGMYTYKLDDYGYDWVIKIIEQETGNKIKKNTSKRKKPIPKKLRIDSWNKYIGEQNGNAYCVCCTNTVISQLRFHAGHIISEANNGPVTLDNIIPICSECNTSMGIRNMEDYIAEHYPGNLENFYLRNYYTFAI